MTTNKLISKGYFPKELPPSFHSELFGADCVRILTEVDSITNSKRSALIATVNTRTDLNSAQKTEERTRLKQIFKNRLAFSDPGIFNIPKHGISRNIIKVPNPFHQAKLAESISANYTHLQTHYDSSNFCVSKPFVETENGEGKRAIYHDNFGVFKEKSIIKSFNFAVELTTDISKFYPSIYTHIIPWVTFGGKEKYKKNRVLSPVDNLRVNNIYGDAIDSRQQWCQNQQTMGIPVGPDTSFLVAELIACHIDKLLEKKLKRKNIDFLGFRYYDDFRMYFHSELEAQIGLTELKNILNDFELKINDQKTKLSKSNSELEKEWALALRTFYFRPSEKDQKEDLWNFFSIAFSYATQFPDESVLKLALVKFNFVRIEESNWSFFESLIFRLGLQETSSLHQIGKLLVTYETLVNKTKLNPTC